MLVSSLTMSLKQCGVNAIIYWMLRIAENEVQNKRYCKANMLVEIIFNNNQKSYAQMFLIAGFGWCNLYTRIQIQTY